MKKQNTIDDVAQIWLFTEFSPQKKIISNLPHFNPAQNDNEKLLNLQKDFYDGKKTALTQMYVIGKKIAKKYINVVAKKNVHVAKLSEDEKDEKAHNAICYLVERFLQNENFVIKTSFTAYIYLRVQHELFYRRKVDTIIDFVDLDKLER